MARQDDATTPIFWPLKALLPGLITAQISSFYSIQYSVTNNQDCYFSKLIPLQLSLM